MNFLNKNLKWVCHHAHFDKSNLITKDLLELSTSHMKEKWYLMKQFKINYNHDDLISRMEMSVRKLTSQNCRHIRTFVDVDSTVGLLCVNTMRELKNRWRNMGVDIQIATQPVEGLAGNSENIKFYEDAASVCDIVGCLPNRDGRYFDEHLDIAFTTAKRFGKPVEAHLDQLNVPYENETDMFCDFVEKYGYEGNARAIHSISLACQPLDIQKEVANRLCKLDIGVIVCPSAAISMTQHSEYISPIHNSIAPVQVLLDAGVNVGLGMDNINDLFMPFCDGNMEFELRLLAESTRIYNLDVLEKIAQNKMGF